MFARVPGPLSFPADEPAFELTFRVRRRIFSICPQRVFIRTVPSVGLDVLPESNSRKGSAGDARTAQC